MNFDKKSTRKIYHYLVENNLNYSLVYQFSDLMQISIPYDPYIFKYFIVFSNDGLDF